MGSSGPFASSWARIFVAALVVAAVLAASGGFGTGILTVAPRTLYWLALTAAGVTTGVLAARFIVPRVWFEERPWLAWGLIAFGNSAPMTLLVALADSLVHGRSLSAQFIVEVFPPTLAVTVAMTALAFLVRRRGPVETHAADPGRPPPKFLQRLPPRLQGAEVWAVEAEDHYLRLHTSLGEDLILMRLGDAVAELEGIEGARTHRSWWVARAAVAGAERAEGRADLTLVDGARVPVSRAYVKRLREAGWF